MIPVVNVQFRDFSTKGSELVTSNADGSYTVILNSRLPAERQKEAYLHALKHIQGEDFSKSDVQAIEFVSHL